MVGEIIYIGAGIEGNFSVKQLMVIEELAMDYLCKDRDDGLHTVHKNHIFLEQNEAENWVFEHNSLAALAEDQVADIEISRPCYVRNNNLDLD